MPKTREEVIDQLKKSRDIVGYLLPVIVDKYTLEIVDGRHRKEADQNWPEERREFESPKKKLLFQIHANNARRDVSKKERASQLCQLALYLEDEGVKPEDMISEVGRQSSFSEEWVRHLLPSRYKKAQMAREKLRFSKPQLAKEAVHPEELGVVFEPGVSKASGLEPTLNVKVECGTQVATGSQGADAEKTAVTFESAAPATKPKTVLCPHCHLDLEIVLCSRCWRDLSVKDLLKGG